MKICGDAECACEEQGRRPSKRRTRRLIHQIRRDRTAESNTESDPREERTFLLKAFAPAIQTLNKPLQIVLYVAGSFHGGLNGRLPRRMQGARADCPGGYRAHGPTAPEDTERTGRLPRRIQSARGLYTEMQDDDVPDELSEIVFRLLNNYRMTGSCWREMRYPGEGMV